VKPMPVKWHEQCLSCSEETYARELDALKIAAQRLKRFRLENDLHRRQIEEAKRRGLEEFDSDRLLVKRKAKQ